MTSLRGWVTSLRKWVNCSALRKWVNFPLRKWGRCRQYHPKPFQWIWCATLWNFVLSILLHSVGHCLFWNCWEQSPFAVLEKRVEQVRVYSSLAQVHSRFPMATVAHLERPSELQPGRLGGYLFSGGWAVLLRCHCWCSRCGGSQWQETWFYMAGGSQCHQVLWWGGFSFTTLLSVASQSLLTSDDTSERVHFLFKKTKTSQPVLADSNGEDLFSQGSWVSASHASERCLNCVVMRGDPRNQKIGRPQRLTWHSNLSNDTYTHARTHISIVMYCNYVFLHFQ